LEFLFRYTYTDTDDSLFEPVIYLGNTYRILQIADKVDEYTVGVDCTWNPMVRWLYNNVHLGVEGVLSADTSTAEGSDRIEHENMLGVRIIFKF